MTWVKRKVQLSAAARDCCLALTQDYHILVIQHINDFICPYDESCFVATGNSPCHCSSGDLFYV